MKSILGNKDLDSFPLEEVHRRHKKPYVSTGYKNPHNFYTFFIYEGSGYGADKVEGTGESASERMEKQKLQSMAKRRKMAKSVRKNVRTYYDMYIEDSMGIDWEKVDPVRDAIVNFTYETVKDEVDKIKKAEKRADEKKTYTENRDVLYRIGSNLQDLIYDNQTRLERAITGTIYKLDLEFEEFLGLPYWEIRNGYYPANKTLSFEDQTNHVLQMDVLHASIEYSDEDVYTKTVSKVRAKPNTPKNRAIERQEHSEMNKRIAEANAEREYNERLDRLLERYEHQSSGYVEEYEDSPAYTQD